MTIHAMVTMFREPQPEDSTDRPELICALFQGLQGFQVPCFLKPWKLCAS